MSVFVSRKRGILLGNKSTACGCQRSAVGCLIVDKKSKSKNGHHSEKKILFLIVSFIVWIALWIMNTCSEFQVNNRDITKCQGFCMARMRSTSTPDNANAITMPRFFSENSRANNNEDEEEVGER